MPRRSVSSLATRAACRKSPLLPLWPQIRSAYSTAFNTALQGTLAGYAANGVMVHYLDLNLVGDRIIADPAAYGLTSSSLCTPTPQCVTDSNYTNGFLFYLDGLHLTSAGFAIVGKYIATQLQAPLTLEATSELGLDTGRQFGRTLSSRVDLGSPRDGEVAQGAHLFIVGDTFSRDVKADDTNDHFDVDGTGVTAGLSYGFPNGTVGIAANYTRPKAKFIGDTRADRKQDVAAGRLRRLRDRRRLRPGLCRLRP